jgi:hypothetical protein
VIVAQEVEQAVHEQPFDLSLERRTIGRRLTDGDIDADDDVAEQPSGTPRGPRFGTRKGSYSGKLRTSVVRSRPRCARLRRRIAASPTKLTETVAVGRPRASSMARNERSMRLVASRCLRVALRR